MGLPSPYQAGTTQPMVVTAEDEYGNVVSDYTGTVTFSSDDPNVVLPQPYTFTVDSGDVTGDDGSHTFDVTLYSSGTSRKVYVTDTAAGASSYESVGPVQVHLRPDTTRARRTSSI